MLAAAVLFRLVLTVLRAGLVPAVAVVPQQALVVLATLRALLQVKETMAVLDMHQIRTAEAVAVEAVALGKVQALELLRRAE